MTSYKLIEKIGSGSYSKVYKAVSQQNDRVLAIKVINLKNAPLNYIQSRQIKILKECHHPNIANLLDCIITTNSVYLVFQYYPMNLNQFYKYYQKNNQKPLDLAKIYNIMIQICSALQYLHSQNIIHRDIKPQNIMIDPKTLRVKLIDFGFAIKLEKQQLTNYIVTRWYRPLEVVIGLNYDKKIDVFGCACIFLQLLNGIQMFQSDSNMDQLHLLLNFSGYPIKNSKQRAALQKLGIQETGHKPIIENYLQGIQNPIKSIIIEMMNNSAQQRPTIDKLLTELNLLSQMKKRQNRFMGQLAQRSKNVAGLTLVSMTHLSKSKGRPMGNPSLDRMNILNKQIERGLMQKVK